MRNVDLPERRRDSKALKRVEVLESVRLVTQLQSLSNAHFESPGHPERRRRRVIVFAGDVNEIEAKGRVLRQVDVESDVTGAFLSHNGSAVHSAIVISMPNGCEVSETSGEQLINGNCCPSPVKGIRTALGRTSMADNRATLDGNGSLGSCGSVRSRVVHQVTEHGNVDVGRPDSETLVRARWVGWFVCNATNEPFRIAFAGITLDQKRTTWWVRPIGLKLMQVRQCNVQSKRT